MGPNYIWLYYTPYCFFFFFFKASYDSITNASLLQWNSQSQSFQCWNLLKSFFLNSLGTKCTNTSAPSFHFQIKWSDMICNTFDLLVFCAWAFGLYSITTMGSLGRDRIMKLKFFFFFFFLSEGWWNLTV